MTATAGHSAQDTFASDPFDPDGPIFQNSPPMKAYRPRLEPSLSPTPALPFSKVSSPPSSGRKASNKKKKVQPSQGDGVLVHYLDGGRQPELALRAAEEPLDGGLIEEEEDDIYDEEDDESHGSSMSGYIGSPKMSPGPRPANGSVDLKSLAGLANDALLALQPSSAEAVPRVTEAQDARLQGDNMLSPEGTRSEVQQVQAQPPPPQPPPQPTQLQPLQPWDVPSKPGLAMPMTPHTPNGPELYSPRLPSGSGLRAPDIMSPIPPTNSHGELPPIMISPKSETNGHTSLPSLPSIGLLTEQHPTEKDVSWRLPLYPRSPPGTGVPRMSIASGVISPTSPNHPFAHSMPSPAQSAYSQSYCSYSNSSGYTPRHPSDFSSTASHHAQSPLGIEQNPTPISNDPRDRMSIDHVTNSQIGQFICKFAGCSAAPFQTQYLLNSHANVHSSARPHYCSVKGCPRAEGGKGFKRKNEMIRHGLVHESPGYVCPFCPDREHKYPRPDNLQRHVRVHHVDKGKDDPQLREVLAQRPDGPSRGRRRRGVS
ncbi:hypothetical protein TruAng_003368 [Truncatella angustata]|nr:hypothetical protein TruAng_003368 [Truncatella angustata]